MASTYSTNLRLELQATGEHRNIWGASANTVFNLIEEAISGYVSVAMADANVTLSANNGSSDQSRNIMVKLTGANTAVRTVTIPAVEKLYLIENGTTGGYAITISNGLTTASIPASGTMLVWTNGTTIYRSRNLAYTSAIGITEGGTGATTAAGARTNLGLDAITDCFTGVIPVPTNKTYKVGLKLPFAGTITETTTISTSGTCTATIKINTSAIGGSSHSVSTSEQSISRSTSNTFAVGDDVQITVSANSSCLDFSFCIAYTRAAV